MDFVRVGYFITLNGPLNGHPPIPTKDHENLKSHRIVLGHATIVYFFTDENEKNG